MKVYMVTSGEYSDYTVDGIFSTKELADAYAAEAKYRDVEEIEVDEIEVDERKEWKNLAVWNARVLANGTLVEDAQTMMLGTPETVQCSVAGAAWYRPIVAGSGRSAKSQEHANKLAIEAYQLWLRQKGA